MYTGPACKPLRDNLVAQSVRRIRAPGEIVGWSKDGHDRTLNSRGQVEYAAVVPHDESRSLEERCQMEWRRRGLHHSAIGNRLSHSISQRDLGWGWAGKRDNRQSPPIMKELGQSGKALPRPSSSSAECSGAGMNHGDGVR
jgi:hypothetical protein